MLCPYCQTLQPTPAPRFCVGCNVVIPGHRPTSWRSEDDAPKVRCQDCGVACTRRVCRACGCRVRWPEDLVPFDEQDHAPPPEPAPTPDGELPGEEVDLGDVD
jgi:hypothetical protein